MKEIVDQWLLRQAGLIRLEQENKTISWAEIAEFIATQNDIDVAPDKEYVRKRWAVVKKSVLEKQKNNFIKSNVEPRLPIIGKVFENQTCTENSPFCYQGSKENKQAGTKELSFIWNADNPPTEQEIIEHFKIDTSKYRIAQIWDKTSFGGKLAISVNLIALQGAEAGNYEEKFTKFVDKYNQTILKGGKYNFPEEEKRGSNNLLYLTTLSDLHIGNTQKEGYVDSIRDRIIETFTSIKNSGVEKVIILNTGDLIHTDGVKGQTTNGTQLDPSDSYEDAFTSALDLITSIIDYAANLSLSVTFVNVRGNHSFSTEFCMGEALRRLYKSNPNVEIINSKDTRVYYYWNNNGFLFTHGDKAVERLPLLFATEGKEVFNKAENHHIYLGHLHHNKGKQFLTDRGEYAGIEVRVLGSPTSNDIWHKQNGFCQNKKSLISFLFTPEEGKYAEFNFKL